MNFKGGFEKYLQLANSGENILSGRAFIAGQAGYWRNEFHDWNGRG